MDKNFELLDKAMVIVVNAFEGKFDKGGKPYILHCLHVMYKANQKDPIAMMMGLMHDLLEDTPWTAQDLRDDGFPEELLSGLTALTHLDDVPYMDYIRGIETHPDVRVRYTKMSDLDHNSRIMRMKGLRAKDFQRLEKYHTAYAYLED